MGSGGLPATQAQNDMMQGPQLTNFLRAAGRAPNYGAFPNGNVEGFDADDLPPEQSAAMTLGMLSSGGMSPGPNFGNGSLGMNQSPNMGGGSSGAEKQGGYPASMASLLNEPLLEGRTGLTPGYSGPESSASAAGMMGPASPFSQMLASAGGGGVGGGFMGMEGLGGDIDWVCFSLLPSPYALPVCRSGSVMCVLTMWMIGRLGPIHPRHGHGHDRSESADVADESGYQFFGPECAAAKSAATAAAATGWCATAAAVDEQSWRGVHGCYDAQYNRMSFATQA